MRGPKPRARAAVTVRFDRARVADGTGARCEPAPDSDTHRSLARAFPAYYGSRRAVCKACHVELVDVEPLLPRAEYWHPRGRECAGERPQYTSVEDAVPLARKQYRRARRRGARAAARYRAGRL
jgi:hypothetical protein